MSHPYWPQPRYLFNRSRLHAPRQASMAGFSGCEGCNDLGMVDVHSQNRPTDFGNKTRTWGSFTNEYPWALPRYILDEGSPLGQYPEGYKPVGEQIGAAFLAAYQATQAQTAAAEAQKMQARTSPCSAAAVRTTIANVLINRVLKAIPGMSLALEVQSDYMSAGVSVEASAHNAILAALAAVPDSVFTQMYAVATKPSSVLQGLLVQSVLPALGGTFQDITRSLKISYSFVPNNIVLKVLSPLQSELKAMFAKCATFSPMEFQAAPWLSQTLQASLEPTGLDPSTLAATGKPGLRFIPGTGWVADPTAGATASTAGTGKTGVALIGAAALLALMLLR